MSKLVLPTTRKQAYRSVLIPIAITAAISVVTLLFTSAEFTKALMLGGMCWFLPHAYVAYKLFHQIETNPKHFLIVFFRAEILKLTFVAVLFIAIIKLLSINFIVLLAGYLCAQLLFWIVAALDR
jgi:F0F1-type ATP synthase assembly protein I